MTYTADHATIARIDLDTYAVTLCDGRLPEVRVYFDVPRNRACISAASADISGTLDCWSEAVGGVNDPRRLGLADAAKNVPHCWTMDELDGFTGFYAYIPE